MGNIHVLDAEVSNKIAAGEVVERPLSIVKELVENSIDAGATNIKIEIINGGVSYIRVTDNGSGMSDEDAKICFLRHATSKIETDSDLNAIYTLGFRGEALSSIGAVSKVALYTKRASDDAGICVTCEGGEILTARDAGAPTGTVIEVRDLFYNTPARLKFLKKNTTEAGYIQDIIGRLAFAHPEISFELVRDGKEVIFTPGDSKLINAVYAVYGKDYARNMLEVDYEFNGIRVSGVVGKGTLVRANRNYESFFVNSRYIKSALMTRALEEAYKNQIMISKFPTAVLNIEADVSTVDINVHPTKLECKFADEQTVYQAVYHAVKTTLYALPNVPEIERQEQNLQASPFKAESGVQSTMSDLFGRSASVVRPASEFKFSTQKRSQAREWEKPVQPQVREDIQPVKREPVPAIYETDKGEAISFGIIPPQKKTVVAGSQKENTAAQAETKQDIIPEMDIKRTKHDDYDVFAMLDYAIERRKRVPVDRKIRVRELDSGEVREKPVEDNWQEYCVNANEEYINTQKNVFSQGCFRVIGQVFNTYILVEKDDKLLLIDQHAAHERLNYERLKEEIENSQVISQMLLMPVELKLMGEEAAVYAENEKLFYDLGFEAELKDDSSIDIKAVPGDLGYDEAEDLFLELLTQRSNMKNDIIADEMQRLIYTIACKASIKANMEISIMEMENLVRAVFELENINTCPHGRPIVISMSKKEIEKDFRRIV